MAIASEDLDSVKKRLDLLAHLLLLLIDPKRIPTISDRIALLASHGLAPAEIGRIIGREANYVSASLKSKKVRKNGE